MTASKNEEKIIYGDGGDWSARAWRRLPDIPNWRVQVKFGDSGWECEPGIYAEPLDTAVAEVAEALSELESLYSALKAFQRQENRG